MRYWKSVDNEYKIKKKKNTAPLLQKWSSEHLGYTLMKGHSMEIEKNPPTIEHAVGNSSTRTDGGSIVGLSKWIAFSNILDTRGYMIEKCFC